jgi:primosomal protein N'
MTMTTLSIQEHVSAPAARCHWCNAPEFPAYEECPSCVAAENVAVEMGVPVLEMLDVARAQWS